MQPVGSAVEGIFLKLDIKREGLRQVGHQTLHERHDELCTKKQYREIDGSSDRANPKYLLSNNSHVLRSEKSEIGRK